MRRTVVVVVAALMVIATALPAAARDRDPLAHETQRVIVQLHPDFATPPAVAAALTTAQYGGTRGVVFEHAVKGFVADLPVAAIAALSQSPAVVAITPDRIVATVAAQDASTGYDRIDAEESPAAPTTTTDCPAGETCTDVDIAVLDTGSNNISDLNVVARTDCSNVILPGFGSCQNGSGADGNGHGTYVAGVAAAFDNDEGFVGVAPGARVHSVKVLSDEGTGYLSAIIAGVDWVTARADTIEVANMSLTGEFSDATLDTAIANSVAAGITYAVASGNDGVDAATYSPAKHPDVITVSAVADGDGAAGGLGSILCRSGEEDDTLATFSNFGEVVDIAAPGVCIAAAYGDGSVKVGSGTSAASPFVAGAAAKYIAMNGPTNPATIKSVLLGDAHPQGSACGFTETADAFPEPMLFLNGPAFGGDGTCEEAVPDPTPPTSPGNLAAVSSGFTVDLSWDASDDPESGLFEYRVYRDTVPPTGEIMVGTAGAAATSYTDTATAPETTYTYEVTAVNLQLGESARSNAAQATTGADDPTNAGVWSFEDGSGTIAADDSPWHRDATLVNGVAWVPGKLGGGVDFDGNNDRLDLDPAILDGADDVTLAAWVKTSKTGQQSIMSGATSGNDNEFLLEFLTHTTLRFFTGYSTRVDLRWTIDSIADGQWHHVVLIRDAATDQATAYIDGVSLGAKTPSQPIDTLSVQALVVGQEQDSVGGGFNASQSLDGTLDELRVYTRLLTQEEIDVLALRDFTPPTAPANLNAVAVGTSVDLGWSPADDAESGISEYEIWRGSGVGIGNPKVLRDTVPGTQSTYRDTAVQPSTAYSYEVVAVNGGNIAGDPSPEATVVTNSGAASLLGWWALDDATGTAATDWSTYGRDGTLVGDPLWGDGAIVGALEFDGNTDRVELDPAVLDGTDDMSLSLWVRTTKTGEQALVSGANHDNTNEFLLQFYSHTQLRYFTGTSTSAGVTWTMDSIADGAWHHIVLVRNEAEDLVTAYRDGVSLGTYFITQPMEPLDVLALVLGQDQDRVDGGYDPSQALVGSMDEVRLYDRLLSAAEVEDLAGLGAPEIDLLAPNAPTGLAATAGDGSVALDWDDNGEPDLASYAVYRAEASGGPYASVAAGVGGSDYVDDTAVNGTTYFYVVIASDVSGNESGYSNEASATPADATPPAAPTGLVATAGDGSVSLDWDDNLEGDLGSYSVYRSLAAGGAYSEVASGVTSSDYVDNSTLNGVTYHYVVTASDTVGNESGYSNEDSATPADTTPPAAPTGLVATAGDGQVGLDWADNGEGDLESYAVYRSESAGGPYGLLVSGLAVSDHTDATAANGTTYFYVVTASDDVGNESGYSNEDSATPVDTTPPAAPTGLVAAAGDGRVDLDWADNGELDLLSYTVYRSLTSGGLYAEIASAVGTSEYDDLTAANGVTYFYVVTASDAVGNESGYSNEDSATPVDATAPAAPAGLVAAGGDSEVSLDWDDNGELDLASYTVYRSLAAGGAYSEIASGVTSSEYVDGTALNGVTYHYVVTASDATGNESGYSNEDSATPADTTPPAAPTGLTATAGDGQVQLDWADNGEGDLASYSVYRSTTAGGPYVEIAFGVGLSAYLDATAVNDTTYFYVVTASDAVGNESASSNEDSATPADATPPAAPTGLVATAGDGSVSLDWDDNGEGDLVSYTVYRSLAAGGPYGAVASGIAASDYEDATAANGETYFYVVTASDTAGNESGYSNEDSATPADTTPPAAPTGLAATAGDNEVSLDWVDNIEPDLVSYSVYRSLVAGGAYSELASGVLASAYVDTTALNDVTYHYVVTASDDAGNDSGYSNEASATPVDMTPPAAPTGLVATAGDGQVSLDWADNGEDDLGSYTVHRSETPGGPYMPIVTGLGASDYVDTTAANGTTYYYVVTAADDLGNESGYSNEAAATPADATPPAVPTGLVATAGDGSVSLDWDDNVEPDLASYIVYRSLTAGGPYVEIAAVGVSAYEDTTAANDVTYYYVVTATDDVGNESGHSDEAAATPVDTTAPAPPTGLVATPGDGQVDLDWVDNAEPDVVSYSVYRSLAAGGAYSEIASNVAASDYSDGTALNGVTYHYVVTAWDGAGNESGYSNEDSATPADATAPAPPTGLTATAGDGQVALDWADNGEPDLGSYAVYRSETAGGPYGLLVSGLLASALVDATAVNGTTYYYVVTASDTIGNESGYSNEDSATPADTTAPAAPTGLAATAGDGQVALDWDNNAEPDLGSYSVYRSPATGGPYSEIASAVGTSDYVDATVVNGTKYFYVVTASDDAGNESGYSNEASATPEAPSVTYADLVLGDGAYHWWRLGESSGTTVFDSAGSHNASYVNGVQLGQPGLITDGDTAAAFDGANDHIRVPDSADINTGGPYAARTVELWFRADDVTSRQVLYEEGGGTRGIAMYLDSGLLYYSVWNRRNDDGAGSWGPVLVTTPVSVGETYHAVLAFDGAGGRLEAYLNGNSVGSQAGVRNLYRHTANVGIGAMYGATYFHDGKAAGTGFYFDGVIDEVALYADPLTTTQVEAHWTAGKQ